VRRLADRVRRKPGPRIELMAEPWRIALITTVTPIVEFIVPALRGFGHEPVAIISARRSGPPPPTREFAELSDSSAPSGLDVMLARDKWSMEPLLRACRPDLAICWGFPWRIPVAALEVPRLGSINQHPAMLPRHRGPIPISWAIRDGDAHYGMTWHRMDANLDTGGILAQTKVPMADDDFTYEVLGPRLLRAALDLLPQVFERIAAGDPGDPQPAEGSTWAGHFGEDYATVDWRQSARAIHNQVRAWAFVTATNPVLGPIAELDGERVRLRRTSLVDPGDGARRVETGDGPIWIVTSEPIEA
jgi:methionyl-tRNA formyltransferase